MVHNGDGRAITTSGSEWEVDGGMAGSTKASKKKKKIELPAVGKMLTTKTSSSSVAVTPHSRPLMTDRVTTSNPVDNPYVFNDYH